MKLFSSSKDESLYIFALTWDDNKGEYYYPIKSFEQCSSRRYCWFTRIKEITYGIKRDKQGILRIVIHDEKVGKQYVSKCVYFTESLFEELPKHVGMTYWEEDKNV